MIRITVKFFAMARDRAGTGEWQVDLDNGATVTAAGEMLAKRFPGLRQMLLRVAFAVNQSYADRSAVLQDGDELAVIPPVSGG